MKSKKRAGFLALLGGMIGLHWFYLRKPFLGLVYIFLLIKMSHIVVMDLPLVLFLSIMNAIQFFYMDEDRFDRKYNRRKRYEMRKNHRGKKQKPSCDKKETTANKTKRKTGRFSYSVQKKVKKYLKAGLEDYKKMDLEGAEKQFLEVVEIDKSNAEAAFYLACIYSVWEDKDRGFEYLEKAVKYGLKPINRIKKEEKLAFLRIQEEYESFVENKHRRTSPKEIPMEESSYVEQLLRLKTLREQGKIKEEVYREEVDKLKGNYGNT